MDRPNDCCGCGAPGWATVVEVVRKREGQPPATIASYHLCEWCAERVERNVAMQVDVHARDPKLSS